MSLLRQFQEMIANTPPPGHGQFTPPPSLGGRSNPSVRQEQTPLFLPDSRVPDSPARVAGCRNSRGNETESPDHPPRVAGYRRSRPDDMENPDDEQHPFNDGTGTGDQDSSHDDDASSTDASPHDGMAQPPPILGAEHPAAKRARLVNYAQTVCTELGLERNSLDGFAAVSFLPVGIQ